VIQSLSLTMHPRYQPIPVRGVGAAFVRKGVLATLDLLQVGSIGSNERRTLEKMTLMRFIPLDPRIGTYLEI
jgi:hypothetical protein